MFGPSTTATVVSEFNSKKVSVSRFLQPWAILEAYVIYLFHLASMINIFQGRLRKLKKQSGSFSIIYTAPMENMTLNILNQSKALYLQR